MPVRTQTLQEKRTERDPHLWAALSAADTLADFARAWLGLQCSFIPGSVIGLVVLRTGEEGAYEPVAQWPPATEDARMLAEISERTIRERSGLLSEMAPPGGGDAGTPHYAMAYPVAVGEELHGVAAISLAAQDQEQVQAAMTQLQWGVGWLELWFRRQHSVSDGKQLDRQRATIDLLATVLSEERADAACMAFVTELSGRFNLDRASLGFVEHDTVSVHAVSHSAQFGQRMNLNRAIAAAMEEAVVQRQEIRYPAPEHTDAVVTRDHELLSRQQGVGAILTVPLFGEDRYYGALTLERAEDDPFQEEEATLFSAVAALAGPVLEAKRLRDRPMPFRAKDAFRRGIGRLFGPEHAGWKLAGVLAVIALLYVGLVRTDYRLSADTVLEGAVQRVLAAPFDGYVAEAPARPGDVVSQGDLLCRLDDRDLRLERTRWRSQQSQLEKRLQEALAGHDRVAVNVVTAQLAQARAQLALVESRLSRTEVAAPFDGVVVTGDLSQRLGGAVQQGEQLFQVTPLNAYRVILKVPENRIGDVRVGQEGRLVLSAAPQEAAEIAVVRVTPVSVAEEGRNYYRVEAELEGPVEDLRPGMEGVAKVFVDRRSILSVWTRNLREWVRLWLWRWLP